MLRSLFIYLSKASWARRLVTGWKFAWRAASRFVAGEKLEDAIQVIKNLNDHGINATLDHLGENTVNDEDARRAADEILAVLDEIDKTGVRANVSIKLTQIGLALDEELCAANLSRILEHASQKDTFIRIDMEDSPWVDTTLRLFTQALEKHGPRTVGLVIQAYLYRSDADIRRLMDLCAHIRLCKGAYKEPANIAFPKKSDVDANYDHTATLLLDKSLKNQCEPISQNGKIPPLPALATHDAKRIKFAKDYAQKIGLPKEAMEFQMLHGIRRDLQESLVAEGYPVRVYVPYGSEWYPYFTRRLAERPANLWFFISNFFRR
jgi:proline dehydrogenase